MMSFQVMMSEVRIVEADDVKSCNKPIEFSRFMQELMGNHKLDGV